MARGIAAVGDFNQEEKNPFCYLKMRFVCDSAANIPTGDDISRPATSPSLANESS
jgi:hypothetical protein